MHIGGAVGGLSDSRFRLPAFFFGGIYFLRLVFFAKKNNSNDVTRMPRTDTTNSLHPLDRKGQHRQVNVPRRGWVDKVARRCQRNEPRRLSTAEGRYRMRDRFLVLGQPVTRRLIEGIQHSTIPERSRWISSDCTFFCFQL